MLTFRRYLRKYEPTDELMRIHRACSKWFNATLKEIVIRLRIRDLLYLWYIG